MHIVIKITESAICDMACSVKLSDSVCNKDLRSSLLDTYNRCQKQHKTPVTNLAPKH